VTGSVVDTLKILNSEHVVLISIDSLESLLDKYSSFVVHLANNDSQELIVGNSTVSVSIEAVEGFGKFSLTELNFHVAHGLSEFGFVQGLIVIFIILFEVLGERGHASGSSLFENILDLFDDSFDRFVLVDFELLSKVFLLVFGLGEDPVIFL